MTTKNGPCEDPRGFDDELAELERIVSELEQGGLGLEAAIERFASGVALLGRCQSTLLRYRKRVEELTGDAERTLAAFADDPDADLVEDDDEPDQPRRPRARS
jgi:exodeoxyribonuclease VII small subunit